MKKLMRAGMIKEMALLDFIFLIGWIGGFQFNIVSIPTGLKPVIAA